MYFFHRRCVFALAPCIFFVSSLTLFSQWETVVLFKCHAFDIVRYQLWKRVLFHSLSVSVSLYCWNWTHCIQVGEAKIAMGNGSSAHYEIKLSEWQTRKKKYVRTKKRISRWYVLCSKQDNNSSQAQKNNDKEIGKKMQSFLFTGALNLSFINVKLYTPFIWLVVFFSSLNSIHQNENPFDCNLRSVAQMATIWEKQRDIILLTILMHHPKPIFSFYFNV